MATGKAPPIQLGSPGQSSGLRSPLSPGSRSPNRGSSFREAIPQEVGACYRINVVMGRAAVPFLDEIGGRSFLGSHLKW